MSVERPMGVLQKAADLVALLAERGPLAPPEIAERIGMPRSSVYRLAEALAQARLTVTLPDSRIKVSERWLSLADAARVAMSEWTGARTVLDELARDTGQTVFLSVPRGDQVVCIDWSQGRAFNVLLLKPGRTLPLYAGAEGRAALAFGDDDLAAEYLARAPFPVLTAATVAGADELRRDRAETRARGFSVSDEDVTDGIGALGVPVVGRGGVLAGVLSLAGLADDVRSRRDELAERLRKGAAELTRR